MKARRRSRTDSMKRNLNLENKKKNTRIGCEIWNRLIMKLWKKCRESLRRVIMSCNWPKKKPKNWFTNCSWRCKIRLVSTRSKPRRTTTWCKPDAAAWRTCLTNVRLSYRRGTPCSQLKLRSTRNYTRKWRLNLKSWFKLTINGLTRKRQLKKWLPRSSCCSLREISFVRRY